MDTETEINHLKASYAKLESEFRTIKHNLELQTISDQRIEELKSRIDFMEKQIALFKQILDKEGIKIPTEYPPYIPYSPSTPLTSGGNAYKPSTFQKF